MCVIVSMTNQDGHINRASISHFGRSRDSDPVFANPGQVKPTTENVILPSQALGIISIGQGLVGSVSGKKCDLVAYNVMVLMAWLPSGAEL